MRVLALGGLVGRAGLPGALWCASPFPLAALSFCFAWPPPGWGCPPLSRCPCRSSLPWRCALVVFLGLPLPGSSCARASFVSPALPLAALWWFLPPPLPFCVSRFSSLLLVALVFFFLFSSPSSLVPLRFLRLSLVSGPRVPWASALCVVCFVGLPLLGSPRACPSFVLSAWLLAAPWWLLPPPPPPLFVSRFSSLPLGAVCRVLCCAVRPWVRCCAALLRVVSSGVVLSSAVLRSLGAAACCAVPSGAARRPGALCSAALCFVVFRRAVCSVLCVFCRGAVVRAVVRRSALCSVCPGVLCCAFPVLSALCGAVLRCAGALALCCSCGACCCWRLVLWCAVVRCWVWWPVVVCWWRVSVSVSLSGRVVCFPVVGVVCCGALLSCVVFCVFYCKPVNDKGGPCHASDCDLRSGCMLQMKRQQYTNDGKPVTHQDHFRCTITCGYCGKRRHYEDECHIKKRESDKLKRQEAERQKTRTPARNPPNGDKGGKGGGKGGGKNVPSNPQRRSSAPVATPTPAATPAPAAGDPKKRPQGGAVLSRGAVLLCSAVVLGCCWGLLCPPVGCRAVLCCAVGWLCCFLPGGGVCVLWCSFPCAVCSLSSPLCALRCLVVLAVVPCFPVSCSVALRGTEQRVLDPGVLRREFMTQGY